MRTSFIAASLAFGLTACGQTQHNALQQPLPDMPDMQTVVPPDLASAPAQRTLDFLECMMHLPEGLENSPFFDPMAEQCAQDTEDYDALVNEMLRPD